MLKTPVFIFLIWALTSCASVQMISEFAPWPSTSQEDLVLAQISDVHWDPHAEFWPQALGILQKTRPQVLVLTGDQLDRFDRLDSWAQALESLDFIPHKYVILGNNDRRLEKDPRFWRDFYKRRGLELLVSEAVEVPWGPDRLKIWGLGPFSIPPGLSDSTGSPVLILIHEPGAFEELLSVSPALKGIVLAGHTHGGQVAFFGIPLVLPGGSGAYVAGWYQKDGPLALYVNRGLGVNSRFPWRFGVSSEVLILRLSPARER